MNNMSIIIPVYNESEGIVSLLNYIQEISSKKYIKEIIIVDGGSTDSTVENITTFSSKKPKMSLNIIRSSKGRAIQMNKGAEKASGNIFYFLHADCLPPINFDQLIVRQIEKGREAGCFKMKFDYNHWWLQLVGWLTILPFKVCRGGDQSLFITASLFNKMQGFNEDYGIYEDMDFISRLYKQTPFAVIPKWLVTSARCYRKHGVWKTQLYYLRIYLKKWFGASPEELQNFYNRTVLKF